MAAMAIDFLGAHEQRLAPERNVQPFSPHGNPANSALQPSFHANTHYLNATDNSTGLFSKTSYFFAYWDLKASLYLPPVASQL
jgi:hypothetical protein